MGLALNPRLLILDEPTQGLSDAEIANFIALMKEIAGETTVLLIEHNMPVVMELAHRITVMHRGRRSGGGNARRNPAGTRKCRASIWEPPDARSPRHRLLLRRGPGAAGIFTKVESGEILCLLGRNGAGKTTALKAIMGLVPTRRGAIAFDGNRLDEARTP